MGSSSSSLLAEKPEKGIYQVFISFNGDNSRDGILSHLIRALERKQINAFDDTKLPRTKSFDTELMRIIEQSDLSIVIFTPDYPKSKYCMKELEKIHESMALRGHLAFPVFHKVDTSVVQNLRGNYAVNNRKWRDALEIISCKSGADEKNFKNEAELIAYVVDEVSKILGELYPNISHGKGFFGIDSRIKEVEEKLRFEMSNEVRMVGVWGIGGIGKTTIADKVFHRNKSKFQGHYFAPNVRETLARGGPSFSLRDKIIRGLLKDEKLMIDSSQSVDDAIRIRISRVRVLLVLDDVLDCFQLNSLLKDCGLDSRGSLARGSRVIVTSRDLQALEDNLFDSHDVYPAQELDDTEALHLLCWSAFGHQSSPPEYAYISKQAVNYACRLPLALVVLGSHLKGKNPTQWKDALNKFQARSPVEIQKVFKISYDGLDEDEQNIFLDIACFLKGKERDYVTNVLEAFGFHARFGIDLLIDKSLVKEEREGKGEIITMHDLLVQFGQNFVAADKKSGKFQSRLWTVADIEEALTNNPQGTENVEVISLEEWIDDGIDIDPEAFIHMSNLRFLNFKFNHSRNWVNCSKVLDFLPRSIKYLHWDNFSQTKWPSKYNSEKLVELHLECSNLEEISWSKPHNCLKAISLHRSTNLRKIPDWGMMPNIEVVDLGYCQSLLKAGSSMEKLSNLTKLYVQYCTSLSLLPELPDSIDEMELRASGLRQLPSTVGHLHRLKQLSLRGCEQLENLPTTISGLRSLEVMDLRKCSSLVEMGPSLENLKNLSRLDVRKCRSLSLLPELPSSIVELVLSRSGLKQLPSTISGLMSLEAIDLSACSSLVEIGSSLENLTRLSRLNVSDCSRLSSLPELPSSIVTLDLFRSGLKGLPSTIGNLTGLKELCLASCTELESLPSSICNLSSLEKLNFERCGNLKRLPEDLGNMKSLKELNAPYSGLTELPQSIRNLNKLINVYLTGSKQLQSVPDLPTNLELFFARQCTSLRNKAKSSLVEQYRKKVHDQPTKIRRFFIDRRRLPKWMMYRTHSGACISLNLQTFGRPINIIFGVVVSSNFTQSIHFSYINPMAMLTIENSEILQSHAYFHEPLQIVHNGRESESYLFMWNCCIECEFLKEVAFTLLTSSNNEIIKSGVHPVLNKKNERNGANKQDMKWLDVDYDVGSLFMEQ